MLICFPLCWALKIKMYLAISYIETWKGDKSYWTVGSFLMQQCKIKQNLLCFEHYSELFLTLLVVSKHFQENAHWNTDMPGKVEFAVWTGERKRHGSGDRGLILITVSLTKSPTCAPRNFLLGLHSFQGWNSNTTPEYFFLILK